MQHVMKQKSQVNILKGRCRTKIDYPKRHIQQRGNLNAAGILKRHKQGTGIDSLLQGSAEEQRKRNELSQKKKSDPQQVKFLIV